MKGRIEVKMKIIIACFSKVNNSAPGGCNVNTSRNTSLQYTVGGSARLSIKCDSRYVYLHLHIAVNGVPPNTIFNKNKWHISKIWEQSKLQPTCSMPNNIWIRKSSLSFLARKIFVHASEGIRLLLGDYSSSFPPSWIATIQHYKCIIILLLRN